MSETKKFKPPTVEKNIGSHRPGLILLWVAFFIEG